MEECCSHIKVVVDSGARIDGRDPRRSNFQGNDEQAKIEDKDSTGNKKGNFVRVGTEERVAFACCTRVRVIQEESEELQGSLWSETSNRVQTLIIFTAVLS